MTLTDRVIEIEKIVGTSPADGFTDLVTRSLNHEERLSRLEAAQVSSAATEAGPSVPPAGQQDQGNVLLDGVLNRMREMEEEISLLRRVCSRQPAADQPQKPKIRVPEPKPFSGARNAKELENFVWDVEQYFLAAKVPDAERINLASMFLTGDAKLWWRTRSAEDRNAGRPGINDWEMLKSELKIQFLPHNVAWVARDQLKRLKQTGSIRDYVKEFSSLLLDIQDMSEADKLFNFQSGLQNWAQVELRRQGVKDLPSAMAAAESLVDFRSAPDPALGERKKFMTKEGKQIPPKKKGKKKESNARKKDSTTQAAMPSTIPNRPLACYFCQGPHKAQDCPKKGKLSAMLAKMVEEEDSSEGEPSRVNPMQALSALVTKESTSCKGLLHVVVKVNGQELQAMIDSGSTNSLIDDQIARDLGLARSTSATLVKTVNAKAAKVHGIAKATPEIGPWVRACSLKILPLDDIEMILGLDFFRAAKGAIVPYLNGMFIGAEECPGFVPIIQHGAMKAKEEAKKEAGKIVSSKQVVHGVQEDHMAYAATLRQVEPEKMEMEVTAGVGDAPGALPPWHGHGHRIGHEMGVCH